MLLRSALSISILGVCLAAQAQVLGGQVYVSGLTSPIAMVQDPTNAGVQYAVQQGGTIRVIQNGAILPTPFLTISVTSGSERGLLGMAFPPDHAVTGHFYIHYTRTISGTVYMQVARFTKSANPLVADPGSQFDIFRTARPFTNHNSGTIRFGQDGFLYFGTGDGGSSGDPGNRAQNPNELLGKMVRIDPRTDDYPADPVKNYAIPPSNPFLPGNNPPITALPEIWAFGLRNVWKFSFDDPSKGGTGALVSADVGQNVWEEFNYEPAAKGGRNYGWKRFEGNAVFSSGTALAYQPHTAPLHVYDHAVGRSITGGFVYRGLMFAPAFSGRYFFGDYVDRRLWSAGLVIDSVTGEGSVSGVTEHTGQFANIGTLGNVASIDVDSMGEIYVVELGGRIVRLVPSEATWLTGQSRSEGVIVGGNVHALASPEGFMTRIQPFTPVFSSTKSVKLNVAAVTNVTTRNQVNLLFRSALNQTLVVPMTVNLRNWNTGNFDVVGTQNINGTMTDYNMGGFSAADYVRSSDGAIEARFDVTYGGVLLLPAFEVRFDQVTFSVN